MGKDGERGSLVRNKMLQFLQALAPMYPQINIAKIARKVYELFGFQDVDEIIPLPDTEKGQGDLTDLEEAYVLSLGQPIDVKYYENHIQKIAFLEQYMNENQQSLSPEAVEAFRDKIEQHVKYLQVLENAMAMMQAQPGEGNAPSGAVPAARPKQESAVSQSAAAQRRITSVGRAA